METLVRAIGALTILMFVLGVVYIINQSLGGRERPPLPGGLHMPALAIEFARAEEVDDILGARDASGDSPARAEIRRGLYGDNVFIAFYWLLFMALSVLLAQRDFSVLAGREFNLAIWLAAAAALCGTSAALSDLVENASLIRLLDAEQTTRQLVANVSTAGYWKWTLSFTAIFLLAFTFLPGRAGIAAFGIIYLIVAASGIYGLHRAPRLIEYVFPLMFVSMPFLGALFAFWPQTVINHLRGGGI